MNRFAYAIALVCLLATLAVAGDRSAGGPETMDAVSKAHSLYERGSYRTAQPHAQRVVQLVRQVKGERHPDYAKALSELADVRRAMGAWAEAEPLYRQALEITKELHGHEHRSVATGLDQLGSLYDDMGEYGQAELFYQQALDMRRKLLGHEHADVARSLSHLASLRFAEGQHAQAESLYQQALVIFERAPGEEPSVAQGLSDLGVLYLHLGQYAKAEGLYRQALAMRGKLLGDQHPLVARSRQRLAELYRAMREHAEAVPPSVACTPDDAAGASRSHQARCKQERGRAVLPHAQRTTICNLRDKQVAAHPAF